MPAADNTRTLSITATTVMPITRIKPCSRFIADSAVSTSRS
jgi:hypothetical protein